MVGSQPMTARTQVQCLLDLKVESEMEIAPQMKSGPA